MVLMKFAPETKEPDTLLHFDHLTGGLKIVSIDASAGFDFEVNGAFAGVVVLDAVASRPGFINRIIDSDLDLPELLWRSSTPLTKNISADWTLDRANTAYLSSMAGPEEVPQTAIFHCPVEGPEITITAGTVYTFQALFGLHRTTGRLRLVFLDGESKVVQAFESEIPAGFLGGRKAEDYANVQLTVRAPAGSILLRIEITKGLTASGPDSYLFFSRPALCRSSTAVDSSELVNDLPDAMTVELFRKASSWFDICDAMIPGEALDGSFNRVAVRNRATGSLSNAVPIALPDAMRCKATLHDLLGSTIVGNMQLPQTWANSVTLSLWIDGKAVPKRYASEAGTGQFRLALPPEHCDGRPHLFDLRLGLSGQSVGQMAAITPVGLTPWHALQKYSGMPMPAHMAPLAAYRYASFQVAASSPAKHSRLDLHQLHDIIVEGFEVPRKEFRVLPFPDVKEPMVSVVIPVHNKFDITYVCLAALLFAATQASFEVIIVDDGSTDTTTRLPEIAPGVVYVRNERALGFVGACNAGAVRARGQYIAFLNNDTEPTAHWLDELLFVFENFDNVGLAGSKLIYPDGLLQEAGGIVWETGDPWNYGRRGNPSDPRYSYTRICDYLSGAAIMIPRTLWSELGGFSREFAPAYFEDTDLAFKVKNAGKKVVFVPHSLVVHYEGLSNGTDQTAFSGLKRFQEINRPKFKRKWSALFAGNGKAGKDVDLAKDRGITRRVVFFDAEFPRVDRDAGSYAAIQEIRMFQALGCKVTFVPTNMAYLGRHTAYLQRLGVETIHTPFYPDITTFLRDRGSEFDLAYITRYGAARQVLGQLADFAPQARTVINVADLHFLRQIRDAMVAKDSTSLDMAMETRDTEISVLSGAELVLSYSAIEQAVITSHIAKGPKTGLLPWVIDPRPLKAPFGKRRDIAFLGGFSHTPNIAAVRFFADEVMPLLRVALPGIRFLVYGSAVPPEVETLASDDVIIKGYVKDVSEVFDSCRVFVAPLLSGAGMKGKVLDCIAAGIPSVLSPIAAEGIGLRDGFDTIIAVKPEEWVQGIMKLYNGEAAWNTMSKHLLELAANRFSFETGVANLREALAAIEFYLPGNAPALHATSARPIPPRYLPESVMGGKIVSALPSGRQQ